MTRVQHAKRRKNDFKKARKYQRLAKQLAGYDEMVYYGLVPQRNPFEPTHKFCKNKKLLSTYPTGYNKTNNGFYGPKFNPSPSYQRRIDKLNASEAYLYGLYGDGFATEEEFYDFVDWWNDNIDADFDAVWDSIWQAYKAERGNTA